VRPRIDRQSGKRFAAAMPIPHKHVRRPTIDKAWVRAVNLTREQLPYFAVFRIGLDLMSRRVRSGVRTEVMLAVRWAVGRAANLCLRIIGTDLLHAIEFTAKSAAFMLGNVGARQSPNRLPGVFHRCEGMRAIRKLIRR
jgi:hypothetical protein